MSGGGGGGANTLSRPPAHKRAPVTEALTDPPTGPVKGFRSLGVVPQYIMAARIPQRCADHFDMFHTGHRVNGHDSGGPASNSSGHLMDSSGR